MGRAAQDFTFLERLRAGLGAADPSMSATRRMNSALADTLC